jgi:FkbM family methyltransferase
MAGPGFHRFMRRMLRWYPYRTPSYELNRALAPLLDRKEPLWLTTGVYRKCPNMVLNVSDRFQRKIYYFPVAYTRHWLGAPFARFLRATVKPGDVFFDVGANIGYYSLFAAELVGPEGGVYAFEPEPGAYESLTRSVENNAMSHVHCVNLALSNKEGSFEMFRARDTAHSLVEATQKDPEFGGAVSVRVTRFDTWAAEAKLDVRRVRALKIDVEGEEPRTVEGMLGTLRKADLPPLWIEVRGPKGSKRAPGTMATTYEVLRPLGYRAYRWNDPAPAEVTEADVVKQEDILFSVPR